MACKAKVVLSDSYNALFFHAISGLGRKGKFRRDSFTSALFFSSDQISAGGLQTLILLRR